MPTSVYLKKSGINWKPNGDLKQDFHQSYWGLLDRVYNATILSWQFIFVIFFRPHNNPRSSYGNGYNFNQYASQVKN